MSKLYIGVVFGGMSAEHDISLQSAKNIARVIDRDRFGLIMIRVNKDGTWCRKKIFNRRVFSNYFDVGLNMLKYLKNRCSQFISGDDFYDLVVCDHGCDIFSGIDVIFPIMHGVFGEDGALQGLLRIKQIPFVGSGILGSALSMDKDVSKHLLRASGLAVSPFVTLKSLDDVLDMNFEYCVDILGLPLFVKPAHQGSSIGVSKVVDSGSFYQAIELAFSLDCKVLVESAIIGRELEYAVLGNKNPKVSVCGEVVLRDKNDFYTYQNKYFPKPQDVKIIIPAKVSNKIDDEMRGVVLRAFHVLECSSMARIDIFLTSDSRIIINEVNTLPGFTMTSMYPKLWEASGLNGKELVSVLIELALEKN